MEQKGKLVLVVGVPGAGKSTLIQTARQEFPSVVFPASWTTRPMRPGETEGAVYHFASDEEFDQAIAAGRFLEWVVIDNGRRYGTIKAAITDELEAGRDVIREVEPIGARRIRELVPGAVVIFITPGSWEDMSRRMLARAPMGAEELEDRRVRYERESAFRAEADYVITNPDGQLARAQQEFIALLHRILDA